MSQFRMRLTMPCQLTSVTAHRGHNLLSSVVVDRVCRLCQMPDAATMTSPLRDRIEDLHVALVLLNPHQEPCNLLWSEHATHVVHDSLALGDVVQHLLASLLHELLAVHERLLHLLAALAACLELLHLRGRHLQLVDEEVEELAARANARSVRLHLVLSAHLAVVPRRAHAPWLLARLQSVPECHLVLRSRVQEVEDLVKVEVDRLLALALVLHELLHQIVHVRCEPVDGLALQDV
mmetsp:Transcript_23062/g.67949  ORF Transcript_23062/g.67949 Transcript_23062/m.67949 type:complete len:236 (-) Transcript_23062:962-1669(-)